MIVTLRLSILILVSILLHSVYSNSSSFAIGYVQSNVLRKINPLASSDSVPATKRKGPSPTSGQTHPSPVIQRRVRKYLQMLVEIEWKSRANPVLRSMPAKSVVNSFTHQFECYSQLRYPFDKPLADGQSVRGWWKALLQNPDASVLAVSCMDLRRSLQY